MSELLLEIDRIRIAYDGHVAVEQASLSIPPGRTVALVGESGSGKSSIARAIFGLAPLVAGTIQLDGTRIADADLRPGCIARTAQLVFQDPNASLHPRRTIGWSIAEPLALATGSVAREQHSIAAQAAELVHLPTRLLDRYPHELSGGQRQRVALARALVLRPKLIVLDEPTSALDVTVQAQILNLLLDLQAELGVAYLLISHNVAVVRHMSDAVAVLYRGQIVESGDAVEILQHPAHPYTQELVAAVPQLGGTRRAAPAAVTTAPGASGCRFAPRCPHRVDSCATEQHLDPRPGGGFVRCGRLGSF